MKKRIASAALKCKADLRIMRLNCARMIRAEDLSERQMRKALNLILGDGALTDDEIECLYEKLIRKSLKK